MIPSTMFGKASKEIKSKIDALINAEINQAEFGELTDQANIACTTVIQQLDAMLSQVETMERITVEAEQAEANHKAMEAAQATAKLEAEQVNEKPVAQQFAERFKETRTSVDNKVATTPIKAPSLRDIQVFLQTLHNSTLSDFGYLFLSNDEQHEQEALGKIKAAFSEFYALKAA